MKYLTSNSLRFVTWVRLLVVFLILILIILTSLIIHTTTIPSFSSIRYLLESGCMTFTIPVFIDSWIYYTDQVSILSDSSLITGFYQYYFSDLDIHPSLNYIYHKNPTFNLYISGVINWFISASLDYVITTYIPLESWVPMLDPTPNTTAIKQQGDEMGLIIQELGEIEKDLITYGETPDFQYMNEINELNQENQNAAIMLNANQNILKLKTQLIPLLTGFVSFTIKSIMSHIWFSDYFIYTKDVFLKLTSFIDVFKEQHNICLNLMNPFTTLMSKGYLNTHLSLDQLNEIQGITNSLLASMENLNITEVEGLANKLLEQPNYWKFEIGSTLFTTLYKLIITSAEHITNILTNGLESGHNIDYSTINNILNTTTVDITNEKLQLIELINNDVSVAMSLMKDMTVTHEINVVQVFNNIIVHLNLDNNSNVYNGYFSNYNFLISVISGINEETSYAINSYIPAVETISAKLWHHILHVYTAIYLPLFTLFILISILAIYLKSLYALCKRLLGKTRIR